MRSYRFAYPGLCLVLCAGMLIALALIHAGCGGTNVQFSSNPPLGTVSVSISDPPSCRVPNGNFKHAYITVRSVRAHISSSADDTAAGWRELAPQLASAPVQIDLLASPQGGCTLARLGNNVSLPVGAYQQIRLLLVSNNPAPGDPLPSTNACGNQGFNCLVLSDDSVRMLELSSQPNTGLKIPPGQIVGGPIRVTEGQHVDINIDFNTCASIVPQPGNRFRLRPTLTAGQVSSVSGLGGRVVDVVTLQPITGGTVLVAIEQSDSTGIDRIVMQTAADAGGNFNFCPLPTGTFDVVAVGLDGAGIAYGPTIVTGVSTGSTLGNIPLIAQTAPNTAAATIQGVVTSASGGSGVSVDAAIIALQAIQVSGVTRQVTIPLLGASTPNVATIATPVSVPCPAGTFCEQYTLIVPASNPSIGNFAMAGTTFSPPAAGDVFYSVEARAFAPMSGGTPICSPSSVLTDKDANDQTLKVTAGTTITSKQLNFTGCI